MSDALQNLWNPPALGQAVAETLAKVGRVDRHFHGAEFQYYLVQYGYTKGVAQRALRTLAAEGILRRVGKRSNLLDETYRVDAANTAVLLAPPGPDAEEVVEPPAVDVPQDSAPLNAQHWSQGEVMPVFAFPAHIENPYPSLAAAIQHVIEQADSQVAIKSPFLERYGVEMFREALLKAVERGARIRLLTRLMPETQQEVAARYLAEELAAAGFSDRLEVRSFHRTNPEGRIAYSLHSKMVMADEKCAYVGSGELRYNSLHGLAEVGVLLRGSSLLEPYAVAWNLLWEGHATSVDLTLE